MSEDVNRIDDPIHTYEALLEHPDTDTQPIARTLDKAIKTIGHVVMWANLALVTATTGEALSRYTRWAIE